MVRFFDVRSVLGAGTVAGGSFCGENFGAFLKYRGVKLALSGS